MVKFNCDKAVSGGSPQYFYNDTICHWGDQTSSWGISKWNDVGSECSYESKGCGDNCAVANYMNNTIVFELFGVNDLCHGISAATCADNKYTMYTMAMNAGMNEEYWIPCIWTLISSAWSGVHMEMQLILNSLHI